MGGNPQDTINAAVGTAATGIGLGIGLMGAMIPLKMMKGVADQINPKKKKKKKQKK